MAHRKEIDKLAQKGHNPDMWLHLFCINSLEYQGLVLQRVYELIIEILQKSPLDVI